MDGFDKLRLVLLFALRYGGDDKVETLKADLGAEGIQNANLIDLLVQYAGKEKHKLGMGAEGGLFERATKVIKAAFKVIGCRNINRIYPMCSRNTSRWRLR